jgi:hypothetical protein
VKALEHYHTYLPSQQRDDSRYLQLAETAEAPELSIRLETFDRARHRQELRRYTDLELILAGRQLRNLIESEKNIVSPFGESPGAWKLQIEDAMAEWRSRQESRRAGGAYAFATLRAARRSRPGRRCGKRPDMKSGSPDNCEPHCCRSLPYPPKKRIRGG